MKPLALALAGTVLFAAGAARADAPANEAAAEALFNEGRALVEAGKIEEGCKKLEASQTLDAGTGTLLHLADCNERSGRTATAWARFREAAARAARENRADWETIARTRARELEPKLAKLRIEAPPGVVVSRDGTEIPAAALGSELPIDPGPHALKATAKGKAPWSGTTTAIAAKVVTVTVPPLADEHVTAPPAAASQSPGAALRTVGYVLGAVGVVGLGVGAVGGVTAISLNNKAKNSCPDPGICPDGDARDNADSARTAATFSTVGFIAGGTLLAAGVVLVLVAPREEGNVTASLRASPHAVLLEGTF